MQQQQQDHFAILGVSHDATEAEIRKRYRLLSLQLHPDKSSLPAEEAAQRFDEVNKAYTYLQDPAVRLQMAQRTQAERAKAERRGAYEGKRKAMAEELEREEQQGAAKRHKENGVQQRQRQEKIQRLKEEAKAMKYKIQGKDVNEQVTPTRQSESEPELGPLDLTVRLRLPSEQFELLCAPTCASSTSTNSSNLLTAMGVALASRFGQLQALLFTPTKVSSSGKKSSEATALATFETLDAAYAAVCLGSELRAAGPPGSASECLQDVHIAWAAAGKSKSATAGEPARIAWLRSQGLLSGQPLNGAPSRASPVHVQAPSEPPPTFSFSSAQPFSASDQQPANAAVYEDSTLLRLRERQRMEEQIRREEQGA